MPDPPGGDFEQALKKQYGNDLKAWFNGDAVVLDNCCS
jgi:hypothetical protein